MKQSQHAVLRAAAIALTIALCLAWGPGAVAQQGQRRGGPPLSPEKAEAAWALPSLTTSLRQLLARN